MQRQLSEGSSIRRSDAARSSWSTIVLWQVSIHGGVDVLMVDAHVMRMPVVAGHGTRKDLSHQGFDPR